MSERILAAQKGYRSLDRETSIKVHNTSKAAENHGGNAGKYIKSIVYGGLDGIITTFAVVASIAGARLDTGIVIIMGFASLIADGISMGMGDFLSSRAENDYTNEERKREAWECDNYIEGEKKEMVDLYMNKGMSFEDATIVIETMSKYRDIFVDCMMVEELGLMPVDPDDSPLKNGLVTFTSFLVFGCVPMIAYVGAVAVGQGQTVASFDVTFIVACVMTLATMFLLGALTARFSSQKWYVAGVWILLNGGAAAIAAYLIGWVLALLVGEGDPVVAQQMMIYNHF